MIPGNSNPYEMQTFALYETVHPFGEYDHCFWTSNMEHRIHIITKFFYTLSRVKTRQNQSNTENL